MNGMTEIDVPDWVVEVACSAAFVEFSENQRADMRSALTAALGAWVVPTVKIGACAEVKWLQGGLCQLPPKEVLYTLRQEKPE